MAENVTSRLLQDAEVRRIQKDQIEQVNNNVFQEFKYEDVLRNDKRTSKQLIYEEMLNNNKRNVIQSK